MKIVAIMLFLVAVFMMLGIVYKAESHEFYSNYCCNDKDCKPISESRVQVLNNGYFLPDSNELIPFTDSRIRQTPIGPYEPYHRCAPDPRYTRCLYVPGAGS